MPSPAQSGTSSTKRSPMLKKIGQRRGGKRKGHHSNYN